MKYNPELLRKCYDECIYMEGMPKFDELTDEQKEVISETLAYVGTVFHNLVNTLKDTFLKFVNDTFLTFL